MTTYRACVLSGGGKKGAYQVGVLQQLINSQRYFGKFSGTSTGALQAAIMAQGSDLREQADMVGVLGNVWHSLYKNSDIYTGPTSTLGKVLTLINKPGLYDPSPLFKLMHDNIDVDRLVRSKTAFSCGVTCLETGKYKDIAQYSAPDNETLLKYILASASMPGYFYPVNIESNHWVDGGVRNVVPPLKSSVDWLKAVSQLEDKLELVVILTSPLRLQLVAHDSWSSLDVIGRAISIMVNETYNNDLYKLADINCEVVLHNQEYIDKRYIDLKLYVPKKYYGDSLNFNMTEIRNMMRDGYEAQSYGSILNA